MLYLRELSLRLLAPRKGMNVTFILFTQGTPNELGTKKKIEVNFKVICL